MTLPALGIDVAKLKFDACLSRPDSKLRHKSFPNSPAGFAQLAAWLVKHGIPQAHACLEATGTYSEALALHLHAAGHHVSLLNPAVIKAYAQSRLTRTKTDKLDAGLIARYVLAERPPLWSPPPPEARELQALVRRLSALEEMRQMERNRLAAGVPVSALSDSITEHLAHLEAEMRRTRALIRDHIGRHPGLRQERDLLLSIPGVGEATAAQLLAEFLDIKLYGSAKQAAAFAGLVPRHRESGSSLRSRPRLSKLGTPRLRKALYFPAITAVRHNPLIKELGARLRARGKCEMVIIGAAMRKLVHIAYGVLKSGRPFDPRHAQSA